MKILAIETSCDDTSLAIVEYTSEGFFCVAMKSLSQIDIHRQYGGVVPELASRSHLHDIILVYVDLSIQAWYDTPVDMMWEIDKIAVTSSPWLPGSLIVGRTFWHMLSARYNKPYQWINHLFWHMFSFLLDRKNVDFKKCLVLSISGWHSDLSLLTQNDGFYGVDKLWTTQDDAIGEVFDKVSRLLWWPYPGGVWIGQQAARYTDEIPDYGYVFKRTVLVSRQYSFSGFKAQANQFIAHYRQTHHTEILSESFVIYLAYQFQEAVLDSLLMTMWQVYEIYTPDTIAIVWWVSANLRLREKMSQWVEGQKDVNWFVPVVYFPVKFDYCTDNAAMIGLVAELDIVNT